jgi:DNA-binding XRE family transcriptional regulator
MPEARKDQKRPTHSKTRRPGRTQMSSGFFTAQKQLGVRIREMRERKSWLQRDLAKAAGLPVRTIGRIERGEVDVRLSTISRIAKALGVTLKDLLP